MPGALALIKVTYYINFTGGLNKTELEETGLHLLHVTQRDMYQPGKVPNDHKET